MKLPFVKMQAQGNDFVIIDGLVDDVPRLDDISIQQLCDRRLGIGCDQLLLLTKHSTADAMMLIYNADASPAANCGNGLRCVGDLLMRKFQREEVSIALADRVVLASRGEDGISIKVNMGQAKLEHVATDYTDINMGNPHRVYFNKPLPCPERNVEMISQYDAEQAHIRIIERGTGETQACGSGACATAMAIWHKTAVMTALTIHMPGGDVVVSMVGDHLYLTGKVQHVFTGEYERDWSDATSKTV